MHGNSPTVEMNDFREALTQGRGMSNCSKYMNPEHAMYSTESDVRTGVFANLNVLGVVPHNKNSGIWRSFFQAPIDFPS